jgi:predicted N-acetyltransferase YhbS
VRVRRVGACLINTLLQAEKRARVVWLSTAKPDYFARFGFRPMSRWQLPIGVLVPSAG